ncbi:MAG: flagellar hook-associated protein FlgK [Rhodospirillales bacterium]|nr:flagellar hook-associated protein FlgK [Rhodospirillales bacterium]
MSLSAALAIASGEVGNINTQFALIGHNVANASTPDYAVEQVAQHSLTAGGIGLGAQLGIVGRSIDTTLQADLYAQNGSVAALQAQTTALQPIDAAQGAPGSGSDLASLLGALGNQFSALETDPASATQQSTVVTAASTLAQQINAVGNAIGGARQTAQNTIVSDVGTLNTTLAGIGALSKRIVAAQAAGQSTADLANQRDAAIDTLSSLVSVNVLPQANGDVLLATAGGLVLPTDGTALATGAASLGAGSYAPGGGVPAITLGGRDVTQQLQGGALGAQITLRDTTLPTFQANLDEFAHTLSTRFAAQGLALFTDAAGFIPAGGGVPTQAGYLGYASEIQVNPAVAALPSLVRDGTTAVAGSAGGASAFTPNPPGGPAGFDTLVTRILDYALGSDVQAGVAQPAPATSGLGATGTLAAGFAPPADLGTQAAAVVAQQASASAAVTGQLADAQGVQTTLQSKLSAGSTVNIDTEMSTMIQLQNAYAANARVMSSVQAMWTQLLQSVGP